MSEPIKAGDLVIVVRDCCGNSLGRIATVEQTNPADDWAALWQCGVCRATLKSAMSLVRLPEISAAPEKPSRGWWPTAWVKRIPPLSELEGENRKEELTA